MQAVAAQQDGGGAGGFAQIADALRRVREGGGAGGLGGGERAPVYGVGGDGGVRPGGEGGGLIQERLGAGDDGAAAGLIEAFAALGAVGIRDRVCAVERVIQAAPAGVGRVQGVARVADGDDELGAGDAGDFRIDVAGLDREGGGLGQEVADFAQERLVCGLVGGGGGVGLVPGVDLRLQRVAVGEEGAVAWGHVGDELGEAGPERVCGDAGAGQGLGFDEGVEGGGDFQPMGFYVVH